MDVYDFTAIINNFLPEPHAGLLSGIVFGTKATLSPDLYKALVDTGTLHIIALSGFNITILSSAVNQALANWLGKRFSSLVSILAIAGFILFVGPTVSIVRAGIMGGISMMAVVFGRKNLPLFTWGIAVAVMLFYDLDLLKNISFQLSTSAALGIIIFSAGSHDWEKKKSVWRKERLAGMMWDYLDWRGKFVLAIKWVYRQAVDFVNDDLRTTLSAQVFTVPIIFYHFHRVSLISPLSNVLIGFAVSIVTVLGLATAFCGWLLAPLGRVFGLLVWVFLEYILQVIKFTGKAPFASLGF